jgi:bis(5'-nucleosyl)-tetraphosphatase (symmetrical)
MEESHQVCRILTLLRGCFKADKPDFAYSGPLSNLPKDSKPWFSFRAIRKDKRRFFFGHWARLGFFQSRNVTCLDSSCVYGGHLTALRIEDGQVFQIPKMESTT